jgi:hypothetical protein
VPARLGVSVLHYSLNSVSTVRPVNHHRGLEIGAGEARQ